MLSLHHFSGLEPLVMSFQSLWYACMLAFDAPLMLYKVGVSCSMFVLLCMPLGLDRLDAI